jgi:hypothetical protein
MNSEYLSYAEMIAERLERLSQDAAWTHRALPWAQGIRKNIAIFRGETEIPPGTSLGKIDFFDYQLERASKVLEEAARK